MRKLLAEFFGTFILVLFGVGTAVLAGQYVGYAGISIAFGLAVMAGIYAFGPISGGHFNPAVTLGLASAGKFKWSGVIPYIIAQLVGATAAAAILYCIVTGTAAGGVDVGGFAANGWSTYTACAAFTIEAVLTFVFLLVILGSTAKDAANKFAGVSIGLALAAIHLVSIPVTNTSVNPARSTSQVFFATDPAALSQLWLFWVAPIAGAIIAGIVWKLLLEKKK
jgi:aquaporin Z